MSRIGEGRPTSKKVLRLVRLSTPIILERDYTNDNSRGENYSSSVRPRVVCISALTCTGDEQPEGT